jgi:hypothetical protein
VPALEQIQEALQQLEDENRRLRDMALSLSLILLRTAAVYSLPDQNASRADVQSLLHLGEECFRTANLAGLKPPIAMGLQAAGHELMAKAVELETRLEREDINKR